MEIFGRIRNWSRNGAMATSVNSWTPVGYDELFQTKNITQTADKKILNVKKKMLFFYLNFSFL
jgi:hypothetical protein